MNVSRLYIRPAFSLLISNHMKQVLFGSILVLLALLTACGSSPDASTSNISSSAAPIAQTDPLMASELVRAWYGSVSGSSDTMSIQDDSSITSSYCGSSSQITAIYPAVSCPSGFDTCGLAAVNINSTNGSAGCLGVGQATCAYATYGSYLSFTCGSDVLTYSRTPGDTPPAPPTAYLPPNPTPSPSPTPSNTTSSVNFSTTGLNSFTSPTVTTNSDLKITISPAVGSQDYGCVIFSVNVFGNSLTTGILQVPGVDNSLCADAPTSQTLDLSEFLPSGSGNSGSISVETLQTDYYCRLWYESGVGGSPPPNYCTLIGTTANQGVSGTLQIETN
jgi:hypothetical protein